MPYREAPRTVTPRRIALDRAPPRRAGWILLAVFAAVVAARVAPVAGVGVAVGAALVIHHLSRGRLLVVRRDALELCATSWLGSRSIGTLELGPGGVVLGGVARHEALDVEVDAVIVGDRGRLEWRVGSAVQWAALRSRLESDLASCGALSPDPSHAVLAGAIVARVVDGELDLTWRPRAHRFLPTTTIVALLAVLLSVAATVARLSGSRAFGGALLLLWFPWLFWRSWRRRPPSRVHAGPSLLAVEPAGAEPAELRLPVQMSVFRDRDAHEALRPGEGGLSLRSGSVSATLGADLTDAELRWLAARLERHQTEQPEPGGDETPSPP